MFRRSLIGGLLAAPFVVRSGLAMPVSSRHRTLWRPDPRLARLPSDLTVELRQGGRLVATRPLGPPKLSAGGRAAEYDGMTFSGMPGSGEVEAVVFGPELPRTPLSLRGPGVQWTTESGWVPVALAAGDSLCLSSLRIELSDA